MKHETGDETADYLLDQLRFLKRVGTAKQKQDAPKWEALVWSNADTPSARVVNFAQAEEQSSSE